jgi:hypothetical protein
LFAAFAPLAAAAAAAARFHETRAGADQRTRCVRLMWVPRVSEG